MEEKEIKRLNQLGRSILRENGIAMEEHQDYDWMRSEECLGYAHYYLQKCWNESELINEADVSIHLRLVNIDCQLGSNASMQLIACLDQTTRWDIIKVRNFAMHMCLLFILEY